MPPSRHYHKVSFSYMSVGFTGLATLLPISGIRLGTMSAGIKVANRRDLVVFELNEGAQVAAVFTRNAFCAAPVILARQHLNCAQPRFLVINTGNANAGTGERGIADALAVCERVARLGGCASNQVLPFSTGVIGEPLPVTKIISGLEGAFSALNAEGWQDAAYGIMTTDTAPKGWSRCIEIGGKTVTITGIAKGSGMIRPDMATMLAYIATDAGITAGFLQECLRDAVDQSFNRITVDGDMSTNDACVLVATGKSGARLETVSSAGYEAFREALHDVCTKLAQAVIKDGEGATKFITIQVDGGASSDECKRVAYTVAESPLVKTAFFGEDPNWGRLLAAIGRAGVVDLDINKVTVFLDDVCLVRDGGRFPDYREEHGKAVMKGSEPTVRIGLGRGANSTTVWTCDFSYDYIKINADYRS